MYVIDQLTNILQQTSAKSNTQQIWKLYAKKYSIENPNLFNVDEIFNEHFHCHIKKSDLCLVAYHFNLIYDKKKSLCYLLPAWGKYETRTYP